MSEESCVYHGKRSRGQLQCLVNQLRAVVPSQHVVRVAPNVCTCDKARHHNTKLKEHVEGLSSADVQQMYTTINNQLTQLNVPGYQFKSLVSSAVDAAASQSWPQVLEAHTSQLRLLILTSEVLKGEYALLNHDKPPAKIEDTNAQKEKKPENITQEFPLSLPVARTYIGLYMGHRGHHLRSLCVRHKCNVHIQVKKEVTAMVTGSKERQVKEIGECLKERAKAVVQGRQRHENQVAAYQQSSKGQRHRRHKQGIRGISGRTAQDIKENMWLSYARKVNHKNNKGRGVKPPRVLEEGSRCVQCLRPYSRGDYSCSYHPGFLVKSKEKPTEEFSPEDDLEGQSIHDDLNMSSKTEDEPKCASFENIQTVWNCCLMPIDGTSAEAQEQSHFETGCSSGRHVWRPTKQLPSNKPSLHHRPRLHHSRGSAHSLGDLNLAIQARNRGATSAEAMLDLLDECSI